MFFDWEDFIEFVWELIKIVLALAVITIFILLIIDAVSTVDVPKEDTIKQYNDGSYKITHHGEKADEWVSPDGVHYWIFSEGYGGFMAPRYDEDGILVID